MNSRPVALIAVLTALAIGTNYLMMPFYNVKLMDVIVFVGGFCCGPIAGALIGLATWAVYGTLNPFGFSLLVWVATMVSESIYGIVGGMVRKAMAERSDGLKGFQVNLCFFFSVLGVFLTIIYDVITNVAFGYVNDWNILFAVVVGFVPFGLLHVVSNALFFGLGCVPTINALFKVIGVEAYGISKE